LAPDAAADALLKNFWFAGGDDNLAELGEGHFHWLKAMEEKGFPAMDGLRAATRNIAVAYGKDDDLGTLEPGKIADILILNDDPLQAAENYRSIHMIIKDGVMVDRMSLPANPILTKAVPPPPETAAAYGRYGIGRYPSCC
jgi:adenine deaminase